MIRPPIDLETMTDASGAQVVGSKELAGLANELWAEAQALRRRLEDSGPKIESMRREVDGMDRKVDAMRTWTARDGDDHILSQTCPICGEQIRAGDVYTLMPVRPGSPEDAEKAAAGRAYNALAALVHYSHVASDDAKAP